jgi:glycosyltransferase involved in cell wall biosynthesis
LAPFLHRSALRQGTIYKTNQLDGAWTAVIAGIVHRRPAIVRAGYLWAELNREGGGRGFKAALINRLQAFSFKRADRVFLTTEAMKQQVVDGYNVSPEKIKVVPNYVDTDRFHPMPAVETIRGRVCFVGRLHPVKNLDMLIEAVSQIPEASLVLIGQGAQRQKLEKLTRDRKANVRFMGVLPQNQIPLDINRSEMFVLPSSSEGHPKALIEAMACGLPVIGANSPGIRELIHHGKTGWLCEADSNGIRTAIQSLMASPHLRAELGRNARQFVLENFTLDRIVEVELAALKEIAGSS